MLEVASCMDTTTATDPGAFPIGQATPGLRAEPGLSYPHPIP